MVTQSEELSKGGGTSFASASNGLPRPQSSLELLSQTAAEMQHSPHVSSAASNARLVSNSSIHSAGTSPKEALLRGVTPTDHSSSNNMSPKQKCLPSLPDISTKQPVFLEQKRSFLPAPLFDPETEGRAATPLYYSPGLFLTYSNGSTAGAAQQVQQPTVATSASSGSEGDAVVPNFLTSHSSFTSSGSLTSAPSFVLAPPAAAASNNTSSSNAATLMPAPAAAFAPPQQRFDNDHQRENYFLRQQLAAKDASIELLQKQVESLQQEVRELRQLPTGKISQIPVE